MPIYAYKCDSCGHSKDVLQKMSDAPLAVCPQCGAPTFKKQLTAAGFQLKGSGWYVTDFRGGQTGAPAEGKKDVDGAAAAGGKAGDAPAKESTTTTAAAPASGTAPAAAASPAPAPAPSSSPAKDKS